jgi:hypothetical protein
VEVANTLAYHNLATIMAVNFFTVKAPIVSVQLGLLLYSNKLECLLLPHYHPSQIFAGKARSLLLV